MRPAQVKICREALRHNVKRVNALSGNKRVVAMVKANAYGHGLIRVASVLSPMVDYLGVASIDEALALREAGIDAKILLIEGVFSAKEYALAITHHLSVVIHHISQLQWLLETPLECAIEVWLKLDSGMHRLGFTASDFNKAYQQLTECGWVNDAIVLMSHMACADEPERLNTINQVATFEQACMHLSGKKSIANSATICAYPDYHFDWLRPGLMLYGVSPLQGVTAASLNLRPVMTLSSKVIALRLCAKGDAVGYGHTWRASTQTLIATVAIGYGDGYPCHLQQNTVVLINGVQAPVVGRVSMDLLTVDVTAVADVAVGSNVILWGSGLPIESVATMAGTIAYDLLCRMPLRVQYSEE